MINMNNELANEKLEAINPDKQPKLLLKTRRIKSEPRLPRMKEKSLKLNRLFLLDPYMISAKQWRISEKKKTMLFSIASAAYSASRPGPVTSRHELY